MKGIPIVPKYEVLRNRKKILRNPLAIHRQNFEKLGDTFRINLSRNNNWIFTRNPESIRHILQTNHKRYDKSVLQTKDLAKYIGHGLLTSSGDFWRVHRRMIQPSFHKKKLEGLLNIMDRAIRSQLKAIKTDTEYDVFPLMGDLAFEVVAQSLFSTDDIHDRMLKLKDITLRNQTMLIKEMRLPYLKWWFRLNGEIKRHLDLSQEARRLLNGLIQKRADAGAKSGKDDLLDMLLAARYEDGSPMPRKQLIDEVLILFTAGHETTANALSFTLFLLAGHPEVQEKLFRETEILDFDTDDKMALLGSLPYTKQCIEESLRLYPPVYFFDRVSLEEDIVGGHSHKKGSVWLMSIFELHRHPDFWEEPNTFWPERFDPLNKKDFSDRYFPFGAGPRMCIGNNFAMYEMIMVVAILVKKYRLSTSMQEVDLTPMITLKPKEVRIGFALR